MSFELKEEGGRQQLVRNHGRWTVEEARGARAAFA